MTQLTDANSHVAADLRPSGRQGAVDVPAARWRRRHAGRVLGLALGAFVCSATLFSPHLRRPVSCPATAIEDVCGVPAPDGAIPGAERDNLADVAPSAATRRPTAAMPSGPAPALAKLGRLIPSPPAGAMAATAALAPQFHGLADLARAIAVAQRQLRPPTAGGDPLFADVDTSTLPIGMQNSNPGNIKFVPGNAWRGQVGASLRTDQGDPQVVFDNSADGMLAAAQLALKKFGWGHDTVRKLIAAPRVGWTPGYLPGAKGVAAAAGFRLDQKLDLKDPEVLARLLRGIVTQEHGPASLLYPDNLIEAAAHEALSG